MLGESWRASLNFCAPHQRRTSLWREQQCTHPFVGQTIREALVFGGLQQQQEAFALQSPMTEMKRKVANDPRNRVVKIDSCDSVQIQNHLEPSAKLCQPPQVALVNKVIFFGGNKWKLRLKDLTSIRLDDTEMVVSSEKWTMTITGGTDASQHHVEQWEQFRERVQRSFDRRNGVDRERKVFGSKKTSSKKARTRAEMLWDEDDRLSTRKGRPTAGDAKASATLSEDEKGLDFSGTDDNDDHPMSVGEKRHSESNSFFAVGKRLKKLSASATSTKESEETDDEEMFDSGTNLTTPAASRVVSPSTRSSSAHTNDEDSSAGGEDDAESNEVGPPQRRIDTFFRAKDSSTPTNTVTPKAPRTPPPSWKRGAALTPARTVARRTSESKYWNTKHTVSSTKTTGLFSSQSPTRPSVQEKRGGELFGSSVKRKIPLALQDPIEEDGTPPQRRQFQRLRLLPSTTRRMNFDNILPHDDEPPARPRFRGLENLGNTCYMNASIQMVSSCTSFMESLAQYTEATLSRRLTELYQQLQVKDARAARPIAIKEAVDAKTDKFTGYEQRDAHEFLADLIDHVHEELDPPSIHQTTGDADKTGDESDASNKEPSGVKKNFPTDDFCTKVKATLRCSHCGYARYVREDTMWCFPFLLLTALLLLVTRKKCIGASRSILCSTKQHRKLPWKSVSLAFSNPKSEKSSVRNAKMGLMPNKHYRLCLGTSDTPFSASSSRFQYLRPKYLLLHLKRFIFVEQPIATVENSEPNSPSQPNQVEYVFKKNKTPVVVPPLLRLDPFLASNSTGPEETSGYQLQSVVHHIGRHASSGHYTAQARRGDDWVTFDDRNSGYTTLDHVTSLAKASTAYLMLYELSSSVEATSEAPLAKALPTAAATKTIMEESI